MAAVDDLDLGDGTVIPAAELDVRFTRSGGPGGQHVNTSDTKVVLRFDVARSPSLDEDQRRVLLERLRSRLTDDGVLVLHASEHRSQTRNREAAVVRLGSLLREALRPRRSRRRTAVPSAAREQRLRSKQRRSEAKALRRRPDAP